VDAKAMTFVLDRDLDAVPEGLAAFHAELPEPRRLVVRYQPSRQKAGAILAAVTAAGLSVVDLSTEESDLEDIFLQLTAGAHSQEVSRGAA
jgi:ABC-2 type transport system ATP-binding protein